MIPRSQIYPDLTLPNYRYAGCGEPGEKEKSIGEQIREAILANPKATYAEIGAIVNRSANQVGMYAVKLGFPKRTRGLKK